MASQFNEGNWQGRRKTHNKGVTYKAKTGLGNATNYSTGLSIP